MDAAEAGCRILEADEKNIYIGIGSLLMKLVRSRWIHVLWTAMETVDR